MTINKALYSSTDEDTNSAEWQTPHSLFAHYHRIYKFDLDAAASDENHLCKLYHTKKTDGLKMPWHGNTWLNPPYGRNIGDWLAKAASEVHDGNAPVVVMLLPARTDTKWYHEWCENKASIEFLKGRLKFVGAKSSAPFPSMVVIFQKPYGSK